jgi:hypothetical protein
MITRETTAKEFEIVSEAGRITSFTVRAETLDKAYRKLASDLKAVIAELQQRVIEKGTVQVFSMGSMVSGAAFHCAFLHATQQPFLEAHELVFAYYSGGVPEASL